MASRLTDKQKKKILADYLDTGSYNATAERNGVCGHTVKRIVAECPEFSEKLEQKKAEKKARATGTRKTVYNFSKRERKVDAGKVNIVNLLADTLKVYNPTIVKPEREIAFSIDGIEYSVTLTKHRAKK